MSAGSGTPDLPQPEAGGAILGLWVGAAAFGNVLAITLIVNNILLQYPHLSTRLRAGLSFGKKRNSSQSRDRSHADLSPGFPSSASKLHEDAHNGALAHMCNSWLSSVGNGERGACVSRLYMT